MSLVYLKKRCLYQLRIIKRQGVGVWLKGVKRRRKYIKLQEVYNFDKWHITPYELRPSAYGVVDYLNNIPGIENMTICEIGCGLGDIIRNTNAKKKIAIDMSREVINCAKTLSKDVADSTEYFVGTLDNAAEFLPPQKLDVDYLITIGFVHRIDSNELKREYENLFSRSNVKNVIVDTLDQENAHLHDFGYVLPDYKNKKLVSQYNVTKVYLLEK